MLGLSEHLKILVCGLLTIIHQICDQMILNLVSFCSIWFDDQPIRGSFPLHLAAALLVESAHHWLTPKKYLYDITIVFVWLSQRYLYDYHKCICMIIIIVFAWLSQLYSHDYHNCICMIITNVFPSESCSSCIVCPPLANTKVAAASICMNITNVFVWLSQMYLYDYHNCICMIITNVFVWLS